MSYPGFTVSLAASKDAQGISTFQIEGERGFIHIRDGSNGLAELQIVTEEGSEVINHQPDPNRWFYEVQGITGLIRSGDYETAYGQLDITLAAVETVEAVRIAAGLYFPGDL